MNTKSSSGYPAQNTPFVVTHQYHRVLVLLHWSVVVLVFITWPVGVLIEFIKSNSVQYFYLIHESLGFLILWVMLVRVGARLLLGAPADVLSGPMHLVAKAVHGLLYLFLIIMPVSGFLMTNAQGFPLRWFGVIPVWSPIGKDAALAGTLGEIHETSAWILLALVGLHIAGALFHHAIKRDQTLYRML